MWCTEGKILYDSIDSSLRHGEDLSLNSLEALLQKHKAAFTCLLENPTKNLQSREKLKKAGTEGVILVDSSKPIILHPKFIEEALLISDLFDLNEVRAAELLLAGEQEMPGFPGLTRGLCAVLIYYQNRRYLAHSLHLLIQNRSGRQWSSDVSEELQELIDTYTERLWKEGLLQKLLDILRSFNIPAEFAKLYENRALGTPLHQRLVQDFLEETRQALADCVLLWCCQTSLAITDVSLLFSHVRACIGISNSDSQSTTKITSALAAVDSSSSPTEVQTLQKTEISVVIAGLYCFDVSQLDSIQNEKSLQSSLPFVLDRDFLNELNREINDVQWSNRGLHGLFQLAWAVTLHSISQHHLCADVLDDFPEDEEDIVDRSIDQNVWRYVRLAFLTAKDLFEDELCVKRLHGLLTQFIVDFPLKLKQMRSTTEEELRFEEECERGGGIRAAPRFMRLSFEQLLLLIGEFYARDSLALSLCREFWCCDASPVDLTISSASETRHGVPFSQKQAALYRFIRISGEFLPSRLYASYVSMLNGLSSNATAASQCFNLLKANSSYGGGSLNAMSWDHLFGALSQYYQSLKADKLSGAAAFHATQIAPAELNALLSWLTLIKTIAGNDSSSRLAFCATQHWAVISSLFGLFACAIPLDLKGAILDCLSAFARSPELVSLLWEAMNAIGVLPVLAEGKLGGVQQDLEDIESKHEVYPVTCGLLGLLSNLWSHNSSLSASGTISLISRPYLDFVLDSVLIRANTRGYKDPSEMWKMLALGLEAIGQFVKSTDLLSPFSATDDGMSAEADTGSHLFAVILSDSPAFRTILWTVYEGIKFLDLFSRSSEREDIERATLAALKLLREVLQRQAAFIAEIREGGALFVCKPLESLLQMINPKTGENDYLPLIARFVAFNDRLPEHTLIALELLQSFCENANMQSRLVQYFNVKQNLRDVIRVAFTDCISAADSSADWKVSRREACSPAEQRGLSAVILLELLNAGLAHPQPNLSHFLLGFDLRDPALTCIENPGIRNFPKTCLHSTIDLLGNPAAHALHRPCYALLLSLASAQTTAVPTLRYLRTVHDFAYIHLQKCPLPCEEDTNVEMELCEQQMLILKLAATELRHLAAGNQRSQIVRLLTLLLQEDAAINTSVLPLLDGTSRMNYSTIAQQSLHSKSYATLNLTTANSRRKLSAILDGLQLSQASLAEPSLDYFEPAKLSEVKAACTSYARGPGSYQQIDVPQLHALLLREVGALQGTSVVGQLQLIQRECQTVLDRAVEFNRIQRERFVRVEAANAWRWLAEVAFSGCGTIPMECLTYEEHAQILVELMKDVLNKIVSTENMIADALAALSSALLVLTVCLRKLILTSTRQAEEENAANASGLIDASLAASSCNGSSFLDGTGSYSKPTAKGDETYCVGDKEGTRFLSKPELTSNIVGVDLAFKLLLQAILKHDVRQSIKAKSFLYGAFLNFCYLTSPSSAGMPTMRCDASMTAGFLSTTLRPKSVPGEAPVRVQLSDEQLNAFHKHASDLLDLFAKDACTASDVVKTLGLCCLNAIISLDNGRRAQLAVTLGANGNLRHLVDSLSLDDAKLVGLFSGVGPEAANLRPLFIFQSRLTLLMAIGALAPGAAILIQHGALLRLAECKCFSITPDQASLLSASGATGVGRGGGVDVGGRYRTALSAALNFCLALINGAGPDNREVTIQVLQFCAAHMNVFSLILQSGSSGNKIVGLEHLQLLQLVTAVVAHTAASDAIASDVELMELRSCSEHLLQQSMALLPVFVEFPTSVIGASGGQKFASAATKSALFADDSFVSASRPLQLANEKCLAAELACVRILHNLLMYAGDVVAKSGSGAKLRHLIFTPTFDTADRQGSSAPLGLAYQALLLALSHFGVVLERYNSCQRRLSSLNDVSWEEQQSLLYDISLPEKLNSSVKLTLIRQRLLAVKQNCKQQTAQLYYIIEVCLALLWRHLEFYLVNCTATDVGDSGRLTPSVYQMLLQSIKSSSPTRAPMRKLQESVPSTSDLKASGLLSRSVMEKLRADAALAFDDSLVQRFRKVEKQTLQFDGRPMRSQPCVGEAILRHLQRMLNIRVQATT